MSDFMADLGILGPAMIAGLLVVISHVPSAFHCQVSAGRSA